jgi:hypothetical protein
LVAFFSSKDKESAIDYLAWETTNAIFKKKSRKSLFPIVCHFLFAQKVTKKAAGNDDAPFPELFSNLAFVVL